VDVFNLKGLLIASLIFVPLERVLPLHRGQKIFRRRFLTDVVYALVNGVLIRVGLAVLIVAAMSTVGIAVPAGVRAAVAGQATWLQVAEIIVIADLGFYGAHRAFHAVPVLWRFHAIHHSIEELDWLAAHRVHPIDQTLTKAASLIPFILLGYSHGAIALFALVYQAHAFLLHSNVRVPFGPLRWVVASPQFHHWHHANERAAYDKNFAGQLSLLDALFGTLHLPGSQVPERYGIDDRISGNYIANLAYPFVRR
jgi:sterol desaturase/sphingolipid hydroxylase (fatty acid hydroxylase superfamily)